MSTLRQTCRPIAWALVVGQLSFGVPLSSAETTARPNMQPWNPPTAVVPGANWAARPAQTTSATRTRRITPNRTVPTVDPVPTSPVFSEVSTDQEIFRARIFPEPLVPVATTSPDDNVALVDAVEAYLSGSQSGVTAFEEFLAQHPVSPWRPSLLANLGVEYLRQGRPSRALAAWEGAWQAGRYDPAPLTRAVADFAVGNWLDLATNIGLLDAVVDRLAEIEGRDVGGSAGAKVQAAREGLAAVRVHHVVTTSGSAALNTLLAVRTGAGYVTPTILAEFRATPAGTSLMELQDLATRVGINLQMAVRTADVSIPIPAVVHFKLDHYSAIIDARGDRYQLRDLVLGGNVWVTRQALLEESSGYFLIPQGPLPTGWRAVAAPEAEQVIGHCAPGYPDDEDPCPCGGPGSGPPPGMPVYDFMPNRASLRLVDLPVGYAPSRGPAPFFKLTYVQREALQPQIFSFWNAGPKWTFDWLSYVTDDPMSSSNAKRVYLRVGGQEQFSGAGTVDVETAPHWRSAARLVRTSSSPIRYERRFRDGSVEVFGQSDGATTGSRRVFLTQIIDPRGQTLTFTYDSSLRLIAATDALGQVTTLAYDVASDPLKVTSITDPFGRSAELTYTSSGQLASITDVIDLTSSFTHGPADFIAAMTTPYGTTSFRHESSASNNYRMIEATDPLGATERLEFHWIDNGLNATAPTAEVPTGFTGYNSNIHKWNTFYWDKRISALFPGDVTKATITHWLITPLTDPFAYHGASSSVPHSIKRPLENRVWYAYPGQDPAGTYYVGTWTQPTKTARVLDDGSSQVWQATYNSNGLMTSQTDPLGRETSYSYDSNGIDVLEARQTTGTLNDLLVSYANYTSGHQPESMTDAAGETTTFTYNSNGQILTVTNALNETTTYAYDTDGYLTSVTGPVTGATTTYAYDDYGRVESVTDSDNYAVVTTYDPLGRPTQMTYPDTTYEAITYDKLDAVTRRDREGKITRTFYDALRRVIAVRDPLGRTITQQWCGCGSLDKLIDAKGQTTTWERDLHGRVTREIRADGNTDTEYTYESTTSRLKAVTDPKGQVTTYSYAADDRLLGMAFTNETISTPDVSFTYETNYPRLGTMVDGTGTTTYGYKAPGTAGAAQVASVDGPLTNDTITMSYDELGRMTARLINGYGISSLSYDALGRLTEEQNELGTFSYGYAATTNRLAAVTYPNGQTSSYSYFGNSGDRRLQTIHHETSAPATLSKFDYTYSPAGNILTWRQQAGTDAVMWEYGYDAAEQLVRAVKKNTDPTPSILKRYAYAYDAAGNRTVEQIDDTVVGASYNNLNRLTSQQPNGLIRVAGTVDEAATVTVQGQPATVSSSNMFEGTATIPAGTSTFTVTATDANNNITSQEYEIANTGSSKTFTYDANGNLTADGTRTFEWDARNQLVAVTVGTHRSEFTYDGNQRRVRIVEKENSVVQSDTRALWCGSDMCEERDAGTSQVVRRYFERGVQEGGQALFYHRDHLSSVVGMTDASGVARARYEYSPYGEATKTAGDLESTVGFGGYRATGSGADLWLSLYRAYDVRASRWASEDPIGDEDDINRYRFVMNGPISAIDPVGLACMPIARVPVSPWFIESVQRIYHGRWQFVTWNTIGGGGPVVPGAPGGLGTLQCFWRRPYTKITNWWRTVAVVWACDEPCKGRYVTTSFETERTTTREERIDTKAVVRGTALGIQPIPPDWWCKTHPPQ